MKLHKTAHVSWEGLIEPEKRGWVLAFENGRTVKEEGAGWQLIMVQGEDGELEFISAHRLRFLDKSLPESVGQPQHGRPVQSDK